MSVTLSIKNVPDVVVERLRARAERHRRSLQGELLAIVEAVAAEADRNSMAMKDLLAWASTQPFAGLGDAAAEVRQMRDERTDRVSRPVDGAKPGSTRKKPRARRRR